VTTLVRGAHVLVGFQSDDEPEWITDAAILVEDGRVGAIGPWEAMRFEHPSAEVLGGRDYVVIPGLVNAHHHVGLTPLQLGTPDHPLELWLASRLALRDVDLYLDTLYGAFEMVASGVTAVQHLHSRAPGSAADTLRASREVIRAYRSIGMRASYSMAFRDQNRLVYEDDHEFVARLPEALRPAMAAYFHRFTVPLDHQVESFDELFGELAEDPLVRVQIAPANLHWLSDSALETVAELATRTGAPLHMHLLETVYQKEYALKRTGGSAIAYLDRFGILGPNLTLGHGVWMTDDDIARCAESGTRICHNCSSNLRLKSGIAPLNRFRAAGIRVAIGIDEAGINDDRDMLQEMRMVLHIHREPGIDAPNPSAAAVLRMATEHGADTTPFGATIGRLAPGGAADLVVLDWSDITHPHQGPGVTLAEVIVQRATPSAVKTVMVNGDVIYRDGAFVRIDRDAVLSEIAERLARPLTPEEEERRVLAAAVMPHVRQFYEGYLGDASPDPHYRPNSRT
jgi:5-methylthioadenosine/S-adenosylhomocysteine deaminase